MSNTQTHKLTIENKKPVIKCNKQIGKSIKRNDKSVSKCNESDDKLTNGTLKTLFYDKRLLQYRPVFYDKQSCCEIKAGGVIIYCGKKLLLMHHQGQYEDPGGKSDQCDDTIEDMVSREVDEESNGVFNRTFIKSKIQNTPYCYILSSKYVVYFVEIDDEIDTELFGNMEINDGINRKFKWINADKFFTIKKHIRLSSREINQRIQQIINTNRPKSLPQIIVT